MAKKTAASKPEEVTVEGIFGEGGLLASRHPGYEFRASQLAMAEVVDAAFQKHQHALIEAGTGTGKTLAYLIPAIRSGRRVVISTATKSLQEQLFFKDVPFIQKHFAPDLKVALMKGRSNFLCRQKVHLMEGQPVLKGIDEVEWFAQIRDWEKVTETGDRAELRGISEMFYHRDAATGARSGRGDRESSFIFCGPGDPAGRFWSDFAGLRFGGVRRSARDRGCGQRLFRATGIELPVRGTFARCGSDPADNGSERGEPAESG